MDILLAPMMLFVDWPILILVPVTFFSAFYFWSRAHPYGSPWSRRQITSAAVIWGLYAIYEWSIYFSSKTGPAAVRFDLLVIVPVRYTFTVLGVVGCWRNLPPTHRGKTAH